MTKKFKVEITLEHRARDSDVLEKVLKSDLCDLGYKVLGLSAQRDWRE